ncbi:MAG: peptidoglycan DD-metalloendopeptidase family protein [Oscillospiraceae bacterium]|nr:peptidoglycan DD-metalloendopeptidase family protein [Oscillospiraceae bacterium]
MNNKKVVSLIAVLLAALMVISLVVSVIPVSAYAVTEDDISAIQQQKKEISGRVADCKERLESLKREQANVLDQKAAIMEQNKLTQQQIDLVQEQIDIYTGMIATKAEEVEAAKGREERQLEKYRTRVRAMEENGGYNILAVVLQADDFGELLTAVDDMGEIMESDRALEDQYIAAREETEEIKAEYEAEKADYEEKQAELKDEQDELKKQMEEAEKQLEELAEEIEKAIKEYKAAEAEEAAAEAEISSIIAQYNAQKEQQSTPIVDESGNVVEGSGNAGNYVSGTGSFIWPVPCSMTVTSRYGNRSDPFTSETRYHAGIDIDGYGKDGQAVVAADSGTVVTASSNSGYGNYVIIDHGGTKTVYAHMSYLAVSAGQSVTQGQTIGGLGATGRATGTHCHFEVYVGNSRTDPAAYFSGITYYNC